MNFLILLLSVITFFNGNPNCEAPEDVDIHLNGPSIIVDTQERAGAIAYEFQIKINGLCKYTIVNYVNSGIANPNSFTHNLHPLVNQVDIKARILCSNNEWTNYTPKETLFIN